MASAFLGKCASTTNMEPTLGKKFSSCESNLAEANLKLFYIYQIVYSTGSFLHSCGRGFVPRSPLYVELTWGNEALSGR